jgi:trafficking protein particle complex subunit 6
MQVALNAIGFGLGRVLAERLTRDRPPMLDQLEVLKWVCKELWTELFKKSIDNLRTNHRGTYVLRDTQFRWTLRLSQNLVSQPERLAPNDLAAIHLVLPCAAIRGALAALGMEATVTADATTLPQCDFTVVVHTTAPGGGGSGGAALGSR